MAHDGDPPQGTYWLPQGAMGQPASTPKPRTPSEKQPVQPGPGWSRTCYPLCLLVVIVVFQLGAQVRSSFGLFSPTHPPLEIRSDPEGASIFINSRLAGATPLRIVNLEPGAYAVRLEKSGRQPVTRRVSLAGRGAALNEVLPEVETGKLIVGLKPDGAEVLLDGVLLGHTPLTLPKVPAGMHELVVRKTNFEPFAQRITIAAADSAVYKDFSLRDKILVMLRRSIETEPHRVGHFVDLGHYLFVNDDLEASADAYGTALALAATQLELPNDTPQVDHGLEVRLRIDDVQRLNGEIRKKESWPGKDVGSFRARIEEAQDRVARKHLDSWSSVSQAADGFIRNNKFERAEDLYQRHLVAVAKNGDSMHGLLGLLNVRLRMHNLSGARETTRKFIELFSQRPEVLLQAGRYPLAQYGAFRDQERAEVLHMAEILLQAAHAGAKDPEQQSVCGYYLAQALCEMSRHEQAAALFKASAAGTKDPATREQRTLEQAGCLVLAKDFTAARAVYAELEKSLREDIRRAAAQAVQALNEQEKKRK